MKVRLLHPASDIDLESQLPWQLAALTNDDLELNRLYDAMATGDTFLLEIAKKVVPLSVIDPDVIVYRQQVLADCLTNRTVVQQIYDIAAAVDGVELRRKVFLGGLMSRNPALILRRSVRVLGLLTKSLRQLSSLSGECTGQFRSTGFRQLFATLSEQLSDDHLTRVQEYLSDLQLAGGVLFSAGLGPGNEGEGYVLHQPPRPRWWARLTGNHNDGYGFVVDEADLAGAQALSKLTGHAINDVANTVTQSADHLQNFFGRLRTELGFYLGCVNLRDELTKRRVPTSFPYQRRSGRRGLPVADCAT